MTPLLDRALAFRRQMLVGSLFKYVTEVQDIEDGYAFRFKRSELLTRRVADYLLFESQHSPHLTFMFIVEPDDGALWLQVRGPEGGKDRMRAAYAPFAPVAAPNL
jgi:hypothetical protein